MNNLQQLKESGFIDKIVSMVDRGSEETRKPKFQKKGSYLDKIAKKIEERHNSHKATLVKKQESLDATQTQFLEVLSKDFNEDDLNIIKSNLISDSALMKEYKNRPMLKEGVSGKLYPKNQFAFNVKYPARGFRDIKRSR